MPRTTSPDTIDSILTAARRLFLEKSYEKTSIQNIVAASGVSNGTIFHHFKTKEDILFAVLSQYFDGTEQEMHKWIHERQGSTAKEKIISLLERLYDDADINSLSSAAQSHFMTLENMKSWVERIAPIISTLFREGNKDGSITTEFPDECAQMFLLIYTIWLESTILKCDENSLRKRLTFIQHTMRALGADIVSHDFIAKCLKFSKKYYRE